VHAYRQHMPPGSGALVNKTSHHDAQLAIVLGLEFATSNFSLWPSVMLQVFTVVRQGEHARACYRHLLL